VRDALTDGGREAHSAEIAEKMAKHGWLGIAIPQAYGGLGGGLGDLCCFLEAASLGYAPIGAFPASMIVGSAYLRFGTEQQKQEILGGIAAGRVEALALSEPGAGSDLAAITCRATPTDGGFVIDGQKIWASNAHLADHILVLARTADDSTGSAGLSMLQVPNPTAGMAVNGIDTTAGRELNMVRFESCLVPEGAIVGMPGAGWLQVMMTSAFERLIIAAVTLGVAQRAFDDTLRYVRTREQFGQRVGTFQALRHRLADLATDLECCRLIVSRVAANADSRSGRLLPKEASMAKLKCTETAKRVCVEGMQMMGAHGTAIKSGMEHNLRSSMLSTLMGGTSEIQREIIGKSLGL
jgi:alkylation response protein AidB-like acyl-CoA dehydrogenase